MPIPLESERKIRNYLSAIKNYSILVEEELSKSSRGSVGSTPKKQLNEVSEKKRQELEAKVKSLFQ